MKFLCFHSLKNSIPCTFSLHDLWWKNVLSFLLTCFFSYRQISLDNLKISHCLDFQKFIMGLLFFLSFWRFTQLLEPIGLCLLTNLESFSYYFFEYSFNSTLFLLSFGDTKAINVITFVIVKHLLESNRYLGFSCCLLGLSSLFPFCHSDYIIFIFYLPSNMELTNWTWNHQQRNA